MATKEVPFYKDTLVYWSSDDHEIFEIFTMDDFLGDAIVRPKSDGINFFHIFHKGKEVEMRPNVQFHDTLKFAKTYKATRFLCESMTTHKVYTMTVADMLDIILNHKMVNGTISGIWTFICRGNWGIKFIGN